MPRRFFLSLISIAVLLLAASTTSFAATEYAQSGTVLRVLTAGGSNGKVLFGVSQVPGHTCNWYATLQFILDTTTPDGKAMYAVLLLAKATGKPIDISYEDS